RLRLSQCRRQKRIWLSAEARSLHSILCKALEIFFDGLAEVSRQLAADLLEDFLTLLRRQIAPAVAFAEIFGLDVAGPLEFGSLTVLHRVLRLTRAFAIFGLLFLLLFHLALLLQIVDHLFEFFNNLIF